MFATAFGLILGGALAACAVLLWWALKPRRNAAPRPASYRCVGISPADRFHACDAVRAVGHQRFLPHQAPNLPLRDCTAHPCRCKFVHFDDRRADNRRVGRSRPGTGLEDSAWRERRKGRGRRKADRLGLLDEDGMRAAVTEKRRQRRR